MRSIKVVLRVLSVVACLDEESMEEVHCIFYSVLSIGYLLTAIPALRHGTSRERNDREYNEGLVYPFGSFSARLQASRLLLYAVGQGTLSAE